MRLLVDTHALLWWVLDDPLLSVRARAAMQASKNTVLVSAATRGRSRSKAARGKLKLPPGAEQRIRDELWAAGCKELAVTWEHGFAVRDLAGPHADPFDRLLIAQARLGGLTIVTDDQAIRGYAVDVLW